MQDSQDLDLSTTQGGTATPPAPSASPSKFNDNEPRYAGHTRFELELEFVTALASPLYLNHLASLKLLTHPPFIAYLSYLRYWSRPEYVKYLAYPGPTLRALELLQEEQFRTDIISPDLVAQMMKEGVEAANAQEE